MNYTPHLSFHACIRSDLLEMPKKNMKSYFLVVFILPIIERLKNIVGPQRLLVILLGVGSDRDLKGSTVHLCNHAKKDRMDNIILKHLARIKTNS